MSHLDYVDDLWATKDEDFGLIARTVSFHDFHPIWSWSTYVTDRQTTCDSVVDIRRPSGQGTASTVITSSGLAMICLGTTRVDWVNLQTPCITGISRWCHVVARGGRAYMADTLAQGV